MYTVSAITSLVTYAVFAVQFATSIQCDQNILQSIIPIRFKYSLTHCPSSRALLQHQHTCPLLLPPYNISTTHPIAATTTPGTPIASAASAKGGVEEGACDPVPVPVPVAIPVPENNVVFVSVIALPMAGLLLVLGIWTCDACVFPPSLFMTLL